ncbi:MAG TPA: glycerophosphodiester phosphodiesterase [Acidimicrobiales bacterium]|nr:glycerophosphodiester phosphodiesterase [Acidimicrobiales bacterium]
MGAFRAAAGVADGVEFDVRRTADGELVVVHDPVVAGLTVADSPRSVLPPWVPTLAEALDACAGLRYVDIEVKNAPHEPGFDPGPALATAIVEAIPPGVAPAAVVTCFHLATVDAARAAGAPATGWLTLPGYNQLAAVDEVAARGHGTILPPDAATDHRLVVAAHDRGLEVVVWTVNNPARAAELAGWGVDGCITDRPAPVAAAVAAAPR